MILRDILADKVVVLYHLFTYINIYKPLQTSKGDILVLVGHRYYTGYVLQYWGAMACQQPFPSTWINVKGKMQLLFFFFVSYRSKQYITKREGALMGLVS